MKDKELKKKLVEIREEIYSLHEPNEGHGLVNTTVSECMKIINKAIKQAKDNISNSMDKLSADGGV